MSKSPLRKLVCYDCGEISLVPPKIWEEEKCPNCGAEMVKCPCCGRLTGKCGISLEEICG